jgi:uncharacterized damage-inducible protein DinB
MIEQYARGGEKLAASVRDLSREEMNWKPPADLPPELGRWSIHQIVIHIADAEAAFADRIRRVIAEDNPTLQAWDENRFAANLFYEDQSAEDAATIVNLTRRQIARILRKLPDEAFNRTGRHTERGVQTIVDILNYAIPHLDHHLKFVHAKRTKLGKPL